MADLLGGKGANLSEMTRMGLPVPPGFTITTQACREFLASGVIPSSLTGEIESALRELENERQRLRAALAAIQACVDEAFENPTEG